MSDMEHKRKIPRRQLSIENLTSGLPKNKSVDVMLCDSETGEVILELYGVRELSVSSDQHRVSVSGFLDSYEVSGNPESP